VVFLPLTVLRVVRELRAGMLAGAGPGAVGRGDLVWAGQAAWSGGGLQAASKRFSHSC
jgi:hypothetical protein